MPEQFSRRGLLRLSYRAAATAGIVAISDAVSTASLPQVPPARVSNDGKEVESTSVLPGLQLYYREDWLGAPWVTHEAMLLIHGNLETGEAWFGWVPRMAQQFRLLRPDLPGFGRSTVPADFKWSLENLSTVLANFLDKLGIASAHIVGAKTGGAIAMVFAALYPERVLSMTVASGPFGPVDPKFENSPQRERFGSSSAPELIDYFVMLKTETDAQTRANVSKMLLTIDVDNYLSRIKAPTLVITTDHSALQSVETVLRYQPKIPNSRLLVLSSDAYHIAVARPDDCVTNVLTFIREARHLPK